jgi:serine/threonine-protein kinase
VGRYAIYTVIASGGMASVHLGRLLGPVGFSRTVAIKRLHPRFARDPEFVAKFLEEAHLVARIKHPHVIPMLDIVATAGELFLVMEYIAGESLARLTQAAREKGERVPARVAVAIVVGLLQGLHAAHEARDEHGHPLAIVHRDVSPQNVLVGVDGQARVLDFGIAKVAGRAQSTEDGPAKGKLGYTAPEQLRGEEVTRHVDVYAAAVVLWELVAGQRLFQAENEGATLTMILRGNVAPPSAAARAAGAVPPSGKEALERLDAVVLRGLHLQPAERFATAREMALALENAVAPATASEVGAWVEQVASATLARRAAEITAIESGALGTPQVPALAPEGSGSSSSPIPVVLLSRGSSEPAPTPAARRGRGPFVVAGVLGASAVVLVVALALSRTARSYPPEPTVSATLPVSATSPSVAPASAGLPEPRAPSSAAEVASAFSPAASLSRSGVAPRPASTTQHPKASDHPRAGAPPGTGCDTPYTWDDQGRKHYKPECL